MLVTSSALRPTSSSSGRNRPTSRSSRASIKSAARPQPKTGFSLTIADRGSRKSKFENRNSAPPGCSGAFCEFRISSFEFRMSAIDNRQFQPRPAYLLGMRGKERGMMPVPSFTVMIWLMGRLVSLSTVPLGQVISSPSMLLRCPRPKWTRGSWADM